MKKFKLVIIVLIIVILSCLITMKLWVNSNVNKQQVPVLMYHNIVKDDYYEGQPDTIKLSTFEKQLKYFKDNGYKTLTLEEFYNWKQGKIDIPEKSVLLTFDDGFYSFHHLVEPLLEEYDFYAVEFVIGSTVKDNTIEYDPDKYSTIGKDLINKHSDHVEYQSHSFSMHAYENGKQKIYSMNKEQLKEDLDKMKTVGNFEYISYPFNTDTNEFIEVLKDNGYKLAFRGEDEKAVRKCNNYQISRIGVEEDFNYFKSIFETKKFNNRYGNGIIRKVFVTLERKLKMRLW